MQPCQPIVYDYCVSGQTRSADGSCVAIPSQGSTTDKCAVSCGGSVGGTNGTTASTPGDGSGSVIARTGLCQCHNNLPLEDVCDEECRLTAPKLTFDGVGNVVLTETDPVTGERVYTIMNSTSIPGLAGSLACTAGGAVGNVGTVGDVTAANCQVAMLQV